MGEQTPLLGMLCLGLSKAKPYLAMVLLQFGYAGMFIIAMISFKHGMSNYVLAVYRHLVATVVIAPFALIFERKIRPKMTISTFLKIMVLALLEPVIDQNLYYLGLKYTSATFASSIINMLPAVTFIMAVIFRLESVKIKKIHSQAKIIGTIVSVGGAMVMTLYKGPVIDFLHPQGSSHHGTTNATADQHWVTGTLMIIASCCVWSGFIILQSFTLRNYPAELSLSALICLMGTIEGAAVTLVMERDMSSWVVGWDSKLLAPVYSGVVCSGIAFYLQGVVIKDRGPVFVTSFSPLCMIITAAFGFSILSEQVHLGSIIGAIFIVIGLYSVVWGKRKDNLKSESLANEKGGGGMKELPITISTKSVTVDGPMGMLNIPPKNPTSQGL